MKHKILKNHRILLILSWLVAAPGLACASLPLSKPPSNATAIAGQVMTEVAQTAAASVPTAPPTGTTAPISAVTGTPEATAVPDVNAALTSTAQAQLGSITAALGNYGISQGEGRLGWVHRPVSLEVKSFHDAKYTSDYPNVVVHDFVAQSDVTWITKTGLAGCGFIFRANPQTKTFYGLGMFRGGNGIAAFNEYQNGAATDWQRYRDVPSANVQDGATNTMGILVRGKTFMLYVNGQLIDTITNPDLANGAVGFVAFSESGTTVCSFNNAFMWVLD